MREVPQRVGSCVPPCGSPSRGHYPSDEERGLMTKVDYTGPLPDTTFANDANGNRTSRTVNGVQEVYTVDQGDKLLSIAVGGTNTREYQYDLEGRRTQKVANG